MAALSFLVLIMYLYAVLCIRASSYFGIRQSVVVACTFIAVFGFLHTHSWSMTASIFNGRAQLREPDVGRLVSCDGLSRLAHTQRVDQAQWCTRVAHQAHSRRQIASWARRSITPSTVVKAHGSEPGPRVIHAKKSLDFSNRAGAVSTRISKLGGDEKAIIIRPITLLANGKRKL